MCIPLKRSFFPGASSRNCVTQCNKVLVLSPPPYAQIGTYYLIWLIYNDDMIIIGCSWLFSVWMLERERGGSHMQSLFGTKCDQKRWWVSSFNLFMTAALFEVLHPWQLVCLPEELFSLGQLLKLMRHVCIDGKHDMTILRTLCDLMSIVVVVVLVKKQVCKIKQETVMARPSRFVPLTSCLRTHGLCMHICSWYASIHRR